MSQRFAQDLLTPAFASNLEELVGSHRVALWIHGHIHDPFDYEIFGTRVVCNPRRRASHLLTMYGFLAYVITTAIMVFGYPTSATPAPTILPVRWHLGALMVCAGGYWFWFVIRVDVAAEGNSQFRVVRADLFILSLLFFGLYVFATTVLVAGIPWSKFSHMFFKPVAALSASTFGLGISTYSAPRPLSYAPAVPRTSISPAQWVRAWEERGTARSAPTSCT